MSTTPGPTASPPQTPSSDSLVWAVPREGEPGWVVQRDAERAGWRVEDVAGEPPWKADPWLAYHIDLAVEQGVLRGDLNLVQRSVAVAARLLRGEREMARREADFLDLMFVTNQEMYRAYAKAKAEQDKPEVQWVSPKTPEDLVALADALSRIAGSEGGWEVAYSEDDPAIAEVDGPFDARDLRGMRD